MKEIVEFSRGAIAGEHDAALLVPLTDDSIQVFRARRAQGFEPEVVDDQQIWLQGGVQAPPVGVICAAGVELAKHVVSAGEQHGVPAPARFMGQSLSQMTFADARWAADDHIPFLPDVQATGQVQDLLAVNGRVEAEIKRFQGLGRVDRCAPEAQG
ncbi:MAG: hypothetical protein M5U01_14620 [Ardenticatenaceae bacterium]|nr:hypothetical protein [Ardenticatenaceae bacterium]